MIIENIFKKYAFFNYFYRFMENYYGKTIDKSINAFFFKNIELQII